MTIEELKTLHTEDGAGFHVSKFEDAYTIACDDGGVVRIEDNGDGTFTVIDMVSVWGAYSLEEALDVLYGELR